MRRPFEEIFEDQTKLGTKVQTDEYHESGAHIIVDQGQEQIAGYTDRKEGIFCAVPAIIFGDHTRIIKYVDEPFFLGADGVKVLRCKIPGANYRYLYYALRHAKIPNTGYNRHFKWLKEVQIAYPDVKQQAEIVTILDGIGRIFAARQRQLRAFDTLIKARFIELYNSSTLSEETNIESIVKRVKVGFVGTCEKYYTDESGIPMLRTGNITENGIDLSDLKFVTSEFHEKNLKSQIHTGDILIARHGSNGQANVYYGPEAQCLNAVIIVPDSNIASSVFLATLINSPMVRSQINHTLVGSTQHVVNTKSIAALTVRIPDLATQHRFVEFVSQVDKSKVVVQKALDEAQILFDSLMQKYFG